MDTVQMLPHSMIGTKSLLKIVYFFSISLFSKLYYACTDLLKLLNCWIIWITFSRKISESFTVYVEADIMNTYIHAHKHTHSHMHTHIQLYKYSHTCWPIHTHILSRPPPPTHTHSQLTRKSSLMNRLFPEQLVITPCSCDEKGVPSKFHQIDISSIKSPTNVSLVQY